MAPRETYVVKLIYIAETPTNTWCRCWKVIESEIRLLAMHVNKMDNDNFRQRVQILLRKLDN